MRTRIRSSAIIIEDGKILLIHRRKEGKEYWVFPGGGVERDETAKEAVVREVREETGLEVSCSQKFAEHEERGKKHPFFICKIVQGGELVFSGPEEQTKDNWYQPKWKALPEVKELILHPFEIRDKLVEKYLQVK
jgi:8-oxo-dGTP diphosphatase